MLHHILDGIAHYIRGYGVLIAEQVPEVVVRDAVRLLGEHIGNQWQYLDPEDFKAIEDAFSYAADFVWRRQNHIFREILDYFWGKGGIEPVGPYALIRLLTMIAEKNNVGEKWVLIFPSARPLTLVAAARKIYSEPRQGRPVSFVFIALRRGKVYDKTYTALSGFDDVVSSMRKLLSSDNALHRHGYGEQLTSEGKEGVPP